MTTKRIFLSDVHMGDDRSLRQDGDSHPYCWFNDRPGGDNRPEMLESFLKNYCIDGDTVYETVINGDLFDEWVCPAEFDPTDRAHHSQQVENIVSAGQNRAVMDQLKIIAGRQKLKYIRGNHDMLTDSAMMQQLFPGIDIIDQPDGHGVYTVDGIWAEHGHWYGLFNAPYPVPDGSFGDTPLPLGFFITRILAEETLKTGSSTTLLEVIGEWAEHIFSRIPRARLAEYLPTGGDLDLVDGILMEFFDTLAADHAQGRPGALMNGYGGIPGLVTWGQVTGRYAHMFNDWSANHKAKGRVGPIEAIAGDNGNLDGAAKLVFSQHNEAKIVIFGHTHAYECTALLGPPPPSRSEEEMHLHLDESPIYANTGAWENATAPCTFVETEFDPDTRYHTVRLREWKSVDGNYVAQNVGRIPDQRVLV